MNKATLPWLILVFVIALVGGAAYFLSTGGPLDDVDLADPAPLGPTKDQPDPLDDMKDDKTLPQSNNGGNTSPIQPADLKKLPVLSKAPTFTLTDQDGREFGSHQLLGKAWIATFIFTRCQATCPVQTGRMVQLQTTLKESPRWKDIRLVSITVDPEHDTSEVLKSYAQANAADADQWKFLRGDQKRIGELSGQGFKLPAPAQSPNPDAPLAHSDKLVLVDPQGDIRGYYETASAEPLKDIERDIDTILQERVLIHPGYVEQGPIGGRHEQTKDLLDPVWLEQRIEQQKQTIGKFEVFHDFSFADRRQESGVTFRNWCVDDAGRTWKPTHYDHGNGVAAADVDGDGLLDLYFVTQAGSNELWRNLGPDEKGQVLFENITEKAGVGVADRIGVTASFADIDNDGDADLYVTNVRGGNVLLENNGKGVFKDISAASGLDYDGHSSAAVFFDFNRDGKLDLFLVNVGIYTGDEKRKMVIDRYSPPGAKEHEFFSANPDAFAAHMDPNRAESSILFENLGGNRFRDVSEKVGLVDKSWSGDACPLDANQDGWIDLYVLNMQGHDEYYENEQGKRFVKKSREVFPATPWGAMGIQVFDFDNDGRRDIYITDMHTDMADNLSPLAEKQKIDSQKFNQKLLNTDGNHVWGNAFFHNLRGKYQEISESIGAENYWPWGLSTGDLNADGYDDAFVASCMNFPFRYAVNSLLLNNRGKTFLDAEFIVGVEPRRRGLTAIPWFELDAADKDRDHIIVKKEQVRGNTAARMVLWGALGSRSSVILDLDQDGDLDIVTNDFNSPPMVLISNLSQRKKPLRYVQVKLKGASSNRDGLGAKVTIHAGGKSWSKVNDGQSGYLSQSRMPLYFGLDAAEKIEKIEVAWPSGKRQTIPGDAAKINSLVTCKEP